AGALSFHRSTNLLQPTCYLQDRSTLSSERGRGIGRSLIEAVCERAQAAGSKRVDWHAQDSTDALRRLSFLVHALISLLAHVLYSVNVPARQFFNPMRLPDSDGAGQNQVFSDTERSRSSAELSPRCLLVD